MSAVDIVFGFLAGVLSCLTPEASMLLPLVVAAIGATDRSSLTVLAIGVGVALILIGPFAGLFGMIGLDARRIVCGVLLLLGIVLLSEPLVARFPRLTGGGVGVLADHVPVSVSDVGRLLALAVLVGANWSPVPGPTLYKASLLAADPQNSALGLAILLGFGIGAALPWIVLGRVIRFFLGPIIGPALHGMAGKRFLGITLLAVAVLGGSGLDLIMSQWVDPMLPAWTKKLAMTF